MKAKDLLSQLSRMEQTLHEFSFEELTSGEATQLKKTFETFRKNLETNIFQPISVSAVNSEVVLPEKCEFEDKTGHETFDATMLIAKVSHEIRTPLNGIIGFSDLLKEDENLNNRQLEQVSAIQKASFSLMEIINELLEYCKLSTGTENFESVEFHFRSVLGDIIYLCKTLVSEKDVALNVAIDDAVPPVLLGDPSKLSQVLLNLIGNAIKFIEEGSIDVNVGLKSKKDKQVFLDFTIADTGIGIAKENLKHIFDVFKQADTDTFSKYGGSGLGLSIVKKIIEKSGGTIDVTSDLGKGTTFEFSIPFEVGTIDNLAEAQDFDIEIQEQQKSIVNGMSILIFEDNALNQRLIEQRLKAWNCKTYITDNAQYGLNILANHNVDLVLMDLKMPGMNGFEITELIRSFEKTDTAPIPVIALSADFSVQDKERCDEHGIDDFIMKPYSSDELLHKLVQNRRPATGSISIPSKSTRTDSASRKVDLSHLLEECMGQLDLLQELISLYKQNTLEFIGNVSIHLQNSDSEQIGFAAHKIKAGLKMMQSKSLLEIIEQMQKCCHTKPDTKHLRFLYDRFLIEYPEVEKKIDTALAELIKSEE